MGIPACPLGGAGCACRPCGVRPCCVRAIIASSSLIRVSCSPIRCLGSNTGSGLGPNADACPDADACPVADACPDAGACPYAGACPCVSALQTGAPI